MKKQDLNNLKESIDKYFNFDISTKTRKKDYFFARCIFYFIAKKTTKYNLNELGKYLGYTDHCSVIHALKVFDYEVIKNPKFNNDFENILSLVKIPYNKELDQIINNVKNNKKINELKEAYEKKIRELNYKRSLNHKAFNVLAVLNDTQLDDIYETRILPYLKINKINAEI